MRRSRASEAGLTLIEIMVVIAILVVVSAVFVMGVDAMLMLEQRDLARKVATTYELLHDEAVLQNVTFRVDFHVDEGYIEVKAGSPDTLIFDDADKREEYEEDQAEEARRQGEEAVRDDFSAIDTSLLTKLEIPAGSAITGFYTPQYGEDLVDIDPTDAQARIEDEEPLVYSSYLFPSGFTEHMIVHITDVDDPTEGWSVEVEPLSGRVHLRSELIQPDDTYDWLPTEAPSLD